MERRVVFDLVLDAGLARGDERRLRVGHGEVDEPDFRGLVIVRRDIAVTARNVAADRQKKSRLGSREHPLVRADRASQPVAEYAGRPMIAIEPHVIERAGVLRPNNGARAIGHRVGKLDPAFDHAHPHGVEFRTGLVGRPRQQPMVGRVPCRAQLEERLAARQRVGVEQQLFLRSVGADLRAFGQRQIRAARGTAAGAGRSCGSANNRRAAHRASARWNRRP